MLVGSLNSNCVLLRVRLATAQIGKPVDDFMGNGGEWGYKGKALGYKVTNKPKVGTAISFHLVLLALIQFTDTLPL